LRRKWPGGFFLRNIILVALMISLLVPAWADAYQVTGKAGGEEIITRGAVLQTIGMNTGEGPLNVYILKVDLSDPYIKVDTIIGSDGTFNKNQSVLEMAKRSGAVAAINGDFFQMKDSGRPIGLAYKGGNLVASPALRNDMYGFGLTKDKTPLLEIFQFSGQVVAGNGKTFPLSGINKPAYLLMPDTSSDIDALTLYNSFWGPVSRGKLPGLEGVVEAVVKNGVVRQVLTDQPEVPIPPDGYVLMGHGEAAKFITENLPAGSKVSYTYAVTPQGDKLFAAVGGQALLVEEGHLPAYFTQNISGKHARTAAGISRDGKTLYLVAVEKQAAKDGAALSLGMSQEELAEFLISIGVWRAVNLDGGGSTTLAARHQGYFDPSLINRPQGGSQRSVPDAIGVFSTAPRGNLKGLVVSGPSVLVAGMAGRFAVKGAYDEYYNPITVDSTKVSWSAAPAVGEFKGGVLTPEKGGIVTVQAEMGGAGGTATVKVVGLESLAGLLVNPASVTIKPGRSVQLTAQVKTKEGETFDLAGQDVQWTVDASLGRIMDGKFIAVNNPASGEIKAAFQGLSATVPVTIKPSWSEIRLTPEQEAEMLMDDRIKIRFPAGSVTEPATIKSAYADNPADLPSGCLPLGAIDIGPTDGQAARPAVPWRLSWQYGPDAVTSRPALMMWDTALNNWRQLPTGIVEDGSAKAVSARVWDFGKIVLVDDHRPAPSFKDTDGHWARWVINLLAMRDVVKGYPDGTFGPDQGVTRAQFVSLLAAALRWPAPEGGTAFKDNVPAWARPAVAAAVSRGVIAGYPDGAFKPDARITRGEMAVMINRALGLGESEAELKYADAASIPGFARSAVAGVTAAGLMQGDGGNFRPGDGATRAETAMAVYRVLNWWVK